MVCQVRKLRLRILPSAQSEHILSFLTIITFFKIYEYDYYITIIMSHLLPFTFFSKDIEISFLLLFLLRSCFFPKLLYSC